MLLWNLGLLRNDPKAFFLLAVVVALSLLIAITVHEFSHALMANRLGDPTAKRMGRKAAGRSSSETPRTESTPSTIRRPTDECRIPSAPATSRADLCGLSNLTPEASGQ